MKKTTQLIIILVLAGLGYGVWHFQDSLPFIGKEKAAAEAKRPAQRPQKVVVATVVRQALPRTITAVGTAKASESVDITSKVAAKINSLNFSEGQKVKVGTLLVQLDDTELEANLTESQAERDNAQKLYDRALKLYATKNVPKAQVDLLLSELQAAEAKVSADKARIGDYRIRAPFSGTLGFREASVGALVRPGDVITTLDDTRTIKIDFDLPESYLAEIHPKQKFSAVSVAYPGKVFEGTVGTIATRVDDVTRSVRVRGLVPNDEDILKPGMFLSVELQVSVDSDALIVAEEAIVLTISGPHVYAVRDGKAVRTPIITGRRIKGFAEIIEGLNEGDEVVVEGLQKVKDGSPVETSSLLRTSEAT
ncbi:MAG: efflux RND transporter periplasmic adaptor subunit [Sneathiella sp.]|nr:efflux RND transporter periplasmic adaptor subunit [Sneathiella sp.]